MRAILELGIPLKNLRLRGSDTNVMLNSEKCDALTEIFLELKHNLN